MLAYTGGILLADVPLTIRVHRDYRAADDGDANMEREQAGVYRRIFASYSHKDLSVVRQFEEYARALGDRYLRDSIDLRAGEVWTERLAEMIQEADVFQLFWSSNSMDSAFVRQEWEYALGLDRPSFVRPTYWEEPLPSRPHRDLPPEALKRLHFERIVVARPPVHGRLPSRGAVGGRRGSGPPHRRAGEAGPDDLHAAGRADLLPDPIAVRPERQLVRVEPGTSASAWITVRNVSNEVAHFRLSLTGTPPSWARLEPEQVSLFGLEAAQVELRLDPPHDAQPAVHPLNLHATSQTRDGVNVVTMLEIEVLAPSRPVGPAVTPVVIVATQRSLRDEDIEVRAEPVDEPELPAAAGRWRLHVRNSGQVLTTLSFMVTGGGGFRPSWWVAEPPQVPLMPDETRVALVTVCLSDEAPVGTHSLTLRTYSHLNLQMGTDVQLRLEVRARTAPTDEYGARPASSSGSNGALRLETDRGAVAVAPGTESRLGLILQNASASPLRVRLSCFGLPDGWVHADPSTPTVPPQTIARSVLILTPPRVAPSGTYPLRVRAEVPHHPNVFSQLDLMLTVATEAVAARSRTSVRLAPERSTLSVLPGSDVEGEVTIENLSTLMMSVELSVDGLDPDWTEVIPREVLVFPQGRAVVRLAIKPPADPRRVIAGLYPLRLRGSPREYPEQGDEAALELDVQLVGTYEPVLEDGQGRAVREATYPLRVRNDANAPARVRFSAADPGSALDYRFEPLEMAVPAGGEASGGLTVRARQPVARERAVAFRVAVEGEFDIRGRPPVAGPGHDLNGRFVQLPRPRLLLSVSPAWTEGTPVGEYEVSVVNPGEEPVAVSLSAGDGAGGLDVRFQSAEATLPSHGEHRTRLQVSARHHPERGEQVRTFQINATPQGNDVLAASAEAALVLRGAAPSRRLPRWAVLAILLALLLAGLALAFPRIEAWLANLMPTATPVPTRPALTGASVPPSGGISVKG